MVEKQAIGRVARLGQSQQVSIYRYIMRGTIEEVRIRDLHEIKAQDQG